MTPILLEKFIFNVVRTNNVDVAWALLAAQVAAGRTPSGGACRAVLDAVIAAAPQPTRLAALEDVLCACQLADMDLSAVADQVVTAAAQLATRFHTADNYACAVRSVALCAAACKDPLVLFHRATSIALRDARHSLLLSALCARGDTAAMQRALQRAASDGAVLWPAATADCLTEIADRGLSDHVGVALSVARGAAVPAGLVGRLVDTCRARGDAATALSVLTLAHRHQLGSDSDRWVV